MNKMCDIILITFFKFPSFNSDEQAVSLLRRNKRPTVTTA